MIQLPNAYKYERNKTCPTKNTLQCGGMPSPLRIEDLKIMQRT